MDSKNLLIRIFTSLFLILFLLIFIYYFEGYISFAILLIYSMIFYEILFFFRNKERRSFVLFLYVFISLVCLEMYIFYFYEKNKIIFLYFILIITCFDIFSYIFGSLFGKKRILPKISPNKTIFGVVAGLLLTLIISLSFNNLFHVFTTFRTSIVFIVLIILSAFIGDVFESFYKRRFEIKNSSNILPGHGGIFDRMDGFVMGSIVMLIFNYFIWTK